MKWLLFLISFSVQAQMCNQYVSFDPSAPLKGPSPPVTEVGNIVIWDDTYATLLADSTVNLSVGTDNPTLVPMDKENGDLYVKKDAGSEEYPLFLKMDTGNTTNWITLNAFTDYVTGDYVTRGEVKSFGVTQMLGLTSTTLPLDPVTGLLDGTLDFVGVVPFTTCVGVEGGGTVTPNGVNFDVTGGFGLIVKYDEFPGQETKYISFPETLGLVASSTEWNTVYVTDLGVVEIVGGLPTATFARINIVLAVVNPTLTEVIDKKGSCMDPGNDLRSLIMFLNLLVRNNFYGPFNATQFKRSAGQIYSYGITPAVDESNLKTTEIIEPVVYNSFTSTTQIGTDINVFDSANYDPDGLGTLTLLVNNRWTYTRIYINAEGDTLLQYGQEDDNDKAGIRAKEEDNRALFVVNPNVTGVYQYQAVIYYEKGADLTLDSQAVIVNGGYSGIGGAGTGGTVGVGDVDGPDSAVEGNIAVFSDISGKNIRDGLIHQTDVMLWKGIWTTGAYSKNNVVTDGQWLMIANKDTSERAGPVEFGSASSDLPDTPSWTEQSQSAVVGTGHIYEFNQGGWVKNVQVWAPEVGPDITYRITFYKGTDANDPTTIVIDNPILTPGAWTIVSSQTKLIRPNSTHAVLLEALNSGADLNVSGGWGYSGTSQNNVVCPGNWNRDNQHIIVRICEVDLDSTDRAAELLGAIPGTTIRFTQTNDSTRFFLYRVNDDPIDIGDQVTYVTTLIDTGNGGPLIGEVTTMDMDIPIPQPTKYVDILNYHPANDPTWATVTGYKEYDGVEQTGNETTAYGVRILFQPGTISTDWDVMSVSGDGDPANSGGN